jgi:mannosyltransferase
VVAEAPAFGPRAADTSPPDGAEAASGETVGRNRDGRQSAAPAAALASAAVATFVVLRHIGTKPLWRDEAISLSVASRPVTRILSVLPHHDANAGLYYLLLHAWLPISGTHPGQIRGLSALCFIATAALGAWAVARWKGGDVGLACGLLIAVNPFLVYYGQEARPYALAVVLATVSTVALFGHEDGPATRLYAVATIALIYADLFGLLFAGAMAVAVVATYRVRRQPVPAALKRCWWIIAAVTAPLALVMVVFERGQISWIGPVNLPVLFTTLTSMTSGWWGLGLLVALAALAVATLRSPGASERDQRIVVALAAAFMLPPAALWSFSQLVPTFIDRYVICSDLALLGLAGAGLAVLRDRAGWIGRSGRSGRAGRAAGAAVVVVVVAVLLALAGKRTATIEAQPFKVDNGPAVVGFIQARSQPGDAVAYAGGGLEILVDTTLQETSLGRRPFPVDIALAPHGEAFSQDDLYPREVSASVLANRLARVQRLWMITDPSDQQYPQGGPFAEDRPDVTAMFQTQATTSFGTVDVSLLVRRA